MPPREEIVSIQVITDDDTGIYDIGEFDFSVPATAHQWLKGRREQFATFLRGLADAAEQGAPPFGFDRADVLK